MATSIETQGEIAPDPHPRGHELELVPAVPATLLGAWVLLRQGSSTGRLLRSGFRTPYAELDREIP